jgi:hypothetical protein
MAACSDFCRVDRVPSLIGEMETPFPMNAS